MAEIESNLPIVNNKDQPEVKKPFPILLISLAVIFIALGVGGGMVYKKFYGVLHPDANQEIQLACTNDTDCVVAIRLNSCCACPEAVSREALKNNINLVEYHIGLKTYPLKTKEDCSKMLCSFCVLWDKAVCVSNTCRGMSENQTTPSPTTSQIPADWETYENGEIKLKFSYPSQLVLEELTNPNRIRIVSESRSREEKALDEFVKENPGAGRGGPIGDSIEIHTVINTDSLSIIEWLKNNNNSSNFQFINPNKPYENIDIAGINAVFYSIEGMGKTDIYAFNSPDNKIVFLIYDEGFAGMPNLVNQILSTFKFTDESSSSDQLIGGQKDEHGCLVGAGYSWCETKQKCLRTWEENCGN